MIYKLLQKANESSIECILRINDNDTYTVIRCDNEVPEYQAYLAWLEEGNTPEPADEGATE